MGDLEDAIREHLDLKRRRGADPAEVAREENDALAPVTRSHPIVLAPASYRDPQDAHEFAPAAREEFAAAPSRADSTGSHAAAAREPHSDADATQEFRVDWLAEDD